MFLRVRRMVLGCASFGLGCVAATSPRPAAPAAATPAALAPAPPVPAGGDAKAPAFDPCREFHAYACSAWIAGNPPPTPKSRWFVDDAMGVVADARLREVLAEPRSGAPWQFYRACLVPENAPAGLTPLLAEVDAIADAADVPRGVGVLARHGVATLFTADLQPDWSTAGRAVFALFPRRATIAEGPVEPLARAVEGSLRAAGLDPAGASQVVRFERARARAVGTGSAAGLRPPLRGRHARWRGLLTGLGAADDAAVVVNGRGYLDAVDRLLRRTPVATVRAWLRWRIVDALARDLGEAASEQAQVLAEDADPPMQRPQWCAWQAAERFPAELGVAFAERVPGAAGLARARAIVAEVQRVAGDLGPAPRVGDAALHAAMRRRFAGTTVRVGHGEPGPQRQLGDDHLANALTLARDGTAAALKAAGGPLLHDRWDSLQFLPTAFNEPVSREISIGVGLLGPPVLGAAAEETGALAGIAAHEMVHALLSGFRHDRTIEWSDAEEQAFAPAVACLSATDRAGFTPTEAEVAEALADLGGLRFAATARRLRERPGPAAGADRRLFLEYAGFFCGSAGPDADADARRRAEYIRWRVDVVAEHLPELRAAFACAPPPEPDACMPW